MAAPHKLGGARGAEQRMAAGPQPRLPRRIEAHDALAGPSGPALVPRSGPAGAEGLQLRQNLPWGPGPRGGAGDKAQGLLRGRQDCLSGCTRM